LAEAAKLLWLKPEATTFFEKKVSGRPKQPGNEQAEAA